MWNRQAHIVSGLLRSYFCCVWFLNINWKKDWPFLQIVFVPTYFYALCCLFLPAVPLPLYPSSMAHPHIDKLTTLGFRFFSPQGTSLILHPVLRCMYMGKFPTPPNKSPTPAGILQFNSILTLSLWGQHQIPPVKAQSYNTAPSPNFRCQPQVQFITCASDWSAKVTSLVLVVSSSFTNLLLQLNELREAFYLLSYLFILKGYNSRRASGRDAQGEKRGKVRSFHALMRTTLPKSLCIHQHRSSPNPVLLGFYGGFIT